MYSAVKLPTFSPFDIEPTGQISNLFVECLVYHVIGQPGVGSIETR